MGYQTAIEWTGTYLPQPMLYHGKMTQVIPGCTFNPWWGCMKVSPACTHCYAETLSNRFGGKHWGLNSERKTFGEKHWKEPLKWDREAKKWGIQRKVFCASMADVFEKHEATFEERVRLWRLIEQTPNLMWLLLTKRPENIIDMIPWTWTIDGYKPKNVMFGATVENQIYANSRIIPLIAAKAKTGCKIFLSMEPLLGPVDLEQYYFPYRLIRHVSEENRTKWINLLDWVIVGGESGPKARPSHPDWFRIIRDQCKKYKVPFFFKQHGEWLPTLQRSAMNDREILLDINGIQLMVGDER
jgi:protein gp37